jgi:hypothetical protein
MSGSLLATFIEFNMPFLGIGAGLGFIAALMFQTEPDVGPAIVLALLLAFAGAFIGTFAGLVAYAAN